MGQSPVVWLGGAKGNRRTRRVRMRILPAMGATLKKPRVAVGAAAAVAEALLERAVPLSRGGCLARAAGGGRRRGGCSPHGGRDGRSSRRPATTSRTRCCSRSVRADAAGALPARAGPDPPDAAGVRADAVPHARRGRAGAGGGRVAARASCPSSPGRRAHPERLLVIIADGWYAVGPALVIAAFADGRRRSTPRGACCCSRWWRRSSSTSPPRRCASGSAPASRPRELLPVLALVYLIDASLAPIGFLAVLASEVHEHAYLLAIAPGALLGLDRPRAQRPDRARARAGARVPALHARARRACRGPAPAGRTAAGGRERVTARARTAPRWSGCCSPPRSRRCRPTAGA